MSAKISKADCIKKLSEVIEDMKEDAKRSRSAQRKRSIKYSIEFYESVKTHLTT